MPRLTLVKDSKGTHWVRRAYRAEDYTAPIRAIRDLDRWRGDYMNAVSLLKDREGPLTGYVEMGRVIREGKEWLVLLDTANEYGIELELLDTGLGEVRPLEPERAYRLACEHDRLRPNPVVYE